ncbi:hypothetical protein K435DRAFT_598527, partial [Dendrothele bispora CBS 962.96]
VIPAMDRIDDLLGEQEEGGILVDQRHWPLHHSVKAALGLAKNLMNHYYQLTDDSSVYRISMVLHPGLKLEYFRQHEWEEEWVRQAERLTRVEYER